jgi:putative aminopeptidase FrvX
MQLLKKLCGIQAPSGSENLISGFVLSYIESNMHLFKVKPEIYSGHEFQDCIVLVFGQPRTAVFAHLDNIGFTVRYNNELLKIGGPKTVSGYRLVGEDSLGNIECGLKADDDGNLSYEFSREIERGTRLSFKPNFREDSQYVQCCYLDNRLGVWCALKLAETIENGAIVFSCWEEHGGGSVGYLTRFLYEKYRIRQALIADITWITEGVHHGKGVVVSLRDSGLPRNSYITRIRKILDKHSFTYQCEVEGSGGSDGNEIQKSPYPVDWCFVGAAEDFVHSPDEKVSKGDIQSMLEAYKLLVAEL